jgi:hypothetical protein
MVRAMDDASFAELVEYAKPYVAREHGIPERYAHRLVGSSLSELHDDAKKMAREVGAHDPTERSRDDATGRFTGTENAAVNEAIRAATGR